MSNIDRTRPKGATAQLLEVKKRARSAASTASTLAAREAAVLAREQAADLRDEVADRRDEAARATAERRAHTETQLLEANEHLVVAAVHSQTMTELAEHATMQMSFKAERDFLTGLPNRALLTDRLAQSIALAQRHGKRVALMYLDLDHFKDINDSLGHSVGDQLLQSVAKRLEGCVRHSDTVSRQGGDEFVVLLSEVEAVQDAALAAEKFIKAMAEPHLIDGHRLNVTLSIGISLYPDDGEDAEAVLTNADTAMYHAKRGGRNNYWRFTPEMNARLVARESL
jgi:diguanylate cyclase (GGDEF)-like protein